MASAYLLLGLAALFVSDVLFVQYLSEPFLSQVQAVKGGVEVLLTAAFIYGVTRRREGQLQRTMSRLDDQREELQVLHRVLRHNLRNDLNVIEGYANWIRERLQADCLETECAKIMETAEQMARYTEQAARIKQIADGDGNVRTYDLTETVPELLDTHPRVTDETETSTTLPERATVEADPMFVGALEELVTNALEYNSAETAQVDVTVVRENASSNMIEIRVSDNGPGIPEAELEPLRAGREEQVSHLSGLGLWFVAWTIRRSGGTLGFEASEREGTTVVVRVPEENGASGGGLSSLVPAGSA